MAGYRHESGAAPQWKQRRDRRQAALTMRLAAATSPTGRMAAVFDYLRGAVRSADPDVAEQVADDVVRQLRDAGDRLLSKGGRNQ